MENKQCEAGTEVGDLGHQKNHFADVEKELKKRYKR